MGTGAFKYCYHQTGSLFFTRVKMGRSGTLIPHRISPCSEAFLGYICELAYYVGVNLVAKLTAAGKGFPNFDITTYTHQATSSSSPCFMEDMDL